VACRSVLGTHQNAWTIEVHLRWNIPYGTSQRPKAVIAKTPQRQSLTGHL
jgi:hypothetical protein